MTGRPMPEEIGPDAAEFWAGARRGEFRVPRCDRCQRVIWFPRAHCPHCGSLDVTWEPLPDPVVGSVYTFTVVRRHAQPFFTGRVPYVVAWVDLDGGPRVLAEVVCDDVDSVRIGDRVRVRWEAQGEQNLHTFVPVTAD